MDRMISRESAPAIGDLRRAERGDSIWLSADAVQRADWARYLDALMTAVTRGAEIRRLN